MSKILLCFCLLLLFVPLTACEGDVQLPSSSAPSENARSASENNPATDVPASPSVDNDLGGESSPTDGTSESPSPTNESSSTPQSENSQAVAAETSAPADKSESSSVSAETSAPTNKAEINLAATRTPPAAVEIIEPKESEVVDENGMYTVEITIGSEVFVAKFYNNKSAQTIIEQMPFSLSMGDYAGQEKVTGLSFDLPNAATERPATIRAGELYLWSGSDLVLFYTTFSNSYSYVPIGYIEDTAGLTKALGSDSVQVAFAVNK